MKMLLRVLAALTSLMLFARLSFAQTYTLNAASNGTTVNTCGGTFYDSGGSGGNYGNNESYTMTFCSNSANCVQLNFTSFRTQGGNDILYLYDGPNTSAPLIGNFSGTTSPGTVVSSTLHPPWVVPTVVSLMTVNFPASIFFRSSRGRLLIKLLT